MSEQVKPIFPERPNPKSEEYKQVFEVLENPPEFELGPEQRLEVEEFEHALSAAQQVPELLRKGKELKLPPKSLTEIIKSPGDRDRYCLDYFIDPKNREELFAILPPSMHSSQLHYFDQLELPVRRSLVENYLSEKTCSKDLSKKQRMDWVSNSSNWAKSKFVDLLTNDIDGDEPLFFSTVNNPELVLEDAKAARELKNYYKEVAANLDTSSDVGQAKLAMLNLHRERLNISIVERYKSSFVLLRQYDHITDLDFGFQAQSAL